MAATLHVARWTKAWQRAARRSVLGVSLLAGTSLITAQGFDLVIVKGRVVDPESGLDGVRSVGVSGGKVTAISDGVLTGKRVIDASEHVVAPGFIDLHEHGQTEEASAWRIPRFLSIS